MTAVVDLEACGVPLAERLSKDMIAIVTIAARKVAEDSRDKFFRDVADLIRPIREPEIADIARATRIAFQKHEGTS